MANGINPINYGTPEGASVKNAGERELRAHRAKGIPAKRVFVNGVRLGKNIGGAPDLR